MLLTQIGKWRQYENLTKTFYLSCRNSSKFKNMKVAVIGAGGIQIKIYLISTKITQSIK